MQWAEHNKNNERDSYTSGKLLAYERGMLGVHRKHMDNFIQINFHPQNKTKHTIYA